MATWKPFKKFKIGDLVRITDYAMKLEVVQGRPNIGIVVSKPYCYIGTEVDGADLDGTSAMVELEHWCYDVMFGSMISKMMPEEYLEAVKTREKK